MSEREQFEQWAMKNQLGRFWRDTEPGYEDQYADSHTQLAWRAWQGRAQLAAPADLVRRLLADHQRVEPHHADQCQLCREATAAIDGQPVPTWTPAQIDQMHQEAEAMRGKFKPGRVADAPAQGEAMVSVAEMNRRIAQHDRQPDGGSRPTRISAKAFRPDRA